MGISRRQFLQGGVLAAAGTALAGKGEASVDAPGLRTKGAATSTTICPFCAVGCGLVVSTKNGKVINIEGDPKHPINQGSLCSKGSSLFQVAVNDQRLQKVMYRAPGSSKFEEKSWDWALDRIARNIKASRDKSFRARNAKGELVNRTEGIASVGSAAMDNEECWLYQKFLRGLGLVYIEHQARV